jgi:hypothetical protein
MYLFLYLMQEKYRQRTANLVTFLLSPGDGIRTRVLESDAWLGLPL